jgi:hypothetical protein
MPPCFDVYVWVRTGDRPAVLSRFIDQYVDVGNPGDPRFEAFTRTLVTEVPAPGDLDALADLRRGPDAVEAFSLYLRAKSHYEAIITMTDEGHLVLGLGLDDPDNDPEIQHQAAELLASMMDEFEATGGIGGVELAPPQSEPEWRQNGLVMLRVDRA